MHFKCNNEEIGICTRMDNNICCFDCSRFLTCNCKCPKSKEVNDASECEYSE